MALLPMTFLSSQITYPKVSSDSTLVIITPSQLKQTNLIFLEHAKFKKINIELTRQISGFQELQINWALQDSIQNDKFKHLSLAYQASNEVIREQGMQIKKEKQKKHWWMGATGAAVIVLIVKIISK